MKFEYALPAMRAGFVIGIHYPINGVTTWYSKCAIHPHDVYVHGFSRPQDIIGQFPSCDVMRDDWVVGFPCVHDIAGSQWFDNNPVWLDIDGTPTVDEIEKAYLKALAQKQERMSK